MRLQSLKHCHNSLEAVTEALESGATRYDTVFLYEALD